MGLTITAWVKVAVVTVLFFWVFYTPCLYRLWQKVNPFWGEPNWGHSIFIPFVGLYYLYLNREELLKAKVVPLSGGAFTQQRLIGGGLLLIALGTYFLGPRLTPNSLIWMVEYATGAAAVLAVLGALSLLADWGIAITVVGLLIFALGIEPWKNDWIKDVGMIITLFGVVVLLCGWQVMKIAWFPIVFLFCGLPWPGLVYSKIAGPLQHLAAEVGVGVLNLCGAAATQVGTKIVIERPLPPSRILNVAEACAGLRSLMTFISVAATVAFLSSRPMWQKIIIALSAIPIAIFCNVMRVAGQGLLDHYASERWSESFAHQFVGLVLLVPAFFLILLVGWLLDHIFIEEIDESDDDGKTGGGQNTKTDRPKIKIIKAESAV